MAQTTTPATDNTVKLQNAISLDRATYFPGEEAVLTLSARNTQRTPLEVPEPFAATNGCFDLSKLASNGAFVPLSSRPVCPFRPMEPAGAKTLFDPGEERRATVTGDAIWQNADSQSSGPGTGYYQVAYRNSTASAVFHIVVPHLETAAAVRLHDIAYNDSNGRAVRAAAYMHVFSVRWFNQSFLCVARSSSLQDKAIVTDLAGNVLSVNVPYRRVAVLPNPVVSIKATANQQDGLAITWTDSTGASQMVLVPSGAPGAPGAGGIEVGLDSTFEKVASGASLQLHARVAGPGNGAVRWSVALGPGAPGGAPTGTVNATGRYEAPAEVNAPYPVIVVAQSLADSSKSALGVVSLQPQSHMTMVAPSDTAHTLTPVAAFSLSEAVARPPAVQ
ncbi:MAG TPA: hypothetical protein VKF41_04335 [Bryobacteraceae bacterium]|nr:hypothetical protein [Bryobacteraceae bacterium]